MPHFDLETDLIGAVDRAMTLARSVEFLNDVLSARGCGVSGGRMSGLLSPGDTVTIASRSGSGRRVTLEMHAVSGLAGDATRGFELRRKVAPFEWLLLRAAFEPAGQSPDPGYHGAPVTRLHLRIEIEPEPGLVGGLRARRDERRVRALAGHYLRMLRGALATGCDSAYVGVAETASV